MRSKFDLQKAAGVFAILVVVILGVHLLRASRAQSPYAAVGASSGTLTSPANLQPDNNASGGKSVQFGQYLSYSIVYDSNRTGNYEIYKMDPGGKVTQLTSDTTYDSWWAKPSPNGSQILFYRTPAGVHDTNYAKTSLWMMNSDGSNLREILPVGANGWTLQGHGEWSPDGTELVMFGNTNIYITDLNGNIISTVATYGLDPTFTPDGKQIVYISCSDRPTCPTSDYRVYRVNVDGSDPTQLENLPYRADDPFTSPDGNTIVWEVNISGLVWDIASMNTDGSNASILFGDNNINTNPTWSPNNVIYFFKTDPGKYDNYGLWLMNRDGSGLQWISQGQTGSNEYVSVVP